VRTPYDSTNAEYIKGQIREKIARTSVTVCLVSALTHQSTWVDWELAQSFGKNSTVICMGLPGGPGTIFLPAQLRARNFPWFLWDHNHLFRLIESAK